MVESFLDLQKSDNNFFFPKPKKKGKGKGNDREEKNNGSEERLMKNHHTIELRQLLSGRAKKGSP